MPSRAPACAPQQPPQQSAPAPGALAAARAQLTWALQCWVTFCAQAAEPPRPDRHREVIVCRRLVSDRLGVAERCHLTARGRVLRTSSYSTFETV
eukprot:gene16938-biopygen773